MPPKNKSNQKKSTSKKTTTMPMKSNPASKKSTPKRPAIRRKSKKARGNDSSADDDADKTTGHLKKDDYLIIIEWLKIEKNYNACFGTGKAPAVGRPAKGKINGFEMMAINLRNQSATKINLTPCQMKDRFNTYKDKYKKVHTKSISTGFGLTDEDRKAGISTIDEKLESMCPHYHAMNELMGDRAFVNPWFKVNAQGDKESTPSSTSEAAGNDIRSSDTDSNGDSVCISTSS